jgi:hypothetical protein
MHQDQFCNALTRTRARRFQKLQILYDSFIEMTIPKVDLLFDAHPLKVLIGLG